MPEFTKLTLLFDENTERDNQQFFFKYIQKKTFSELKKSVIYAVIFLCLGFFPLEGLQKSPIPYIFKYLGFIYIGYIYYLVYQYFASKKKTYKSIEDTIKELKKKDENLYSITLDENNISIENPFNTINSVWEKTSYKFIDKYLILSTLNGYLSFIFTSFEFKNNDYQILLDYLQKNSKQIN
ncbi:hypothetical protein [Chryseobacterium lathyri]|uniref:hypothetical protein n=1 Tax=Chryseobacterium lathyri TaxID=395933 RepID=UPI0027871319|nr:hypothetical protein [Chryseobacterium lathyri]MDQ0067978.1 hypothetical protein [Chryseobacterium lathyri]